jgi:hypothetical protein
MKRLAKRKRYTGRPSSTEVLRESRSGVPAAELTEIYHKLTVVRATAYVCASALAHEAADNDVDVGLVLKRSVGDELDRQLERLDQILERKP